MKDLFNSKEHFRVIKRSLHILALTQNTNSDNKWNHNSLTNIIRCEEPKIGEGAIKNAIKKMDELFGVSPIVEKGSRYIIGATLTNKQEIELIKIYTNFITQDLIRDKNIKLFQDKHKGKALWLLATIYFAIKEKRVLELEYTSATSRQTKKFTVRPYYIIAHRNGLYLSSHNIKFDSIAHYALHRIEKVEQKEATYEEDIPPLEEIYKYSYGPYVNKKLYNFEIVVQNDKLKNVMENFVHLKPITEPIDEEKTKISFSIADYKNVCKELFFYAKETEIIKPQKARDYMKIIGQSLVEKYNS